MGRGTLSETWREGKMRKKLLIAVLIIIAALLTGCEKKTVPNTEVEAFLNTGISAQKAFDAVDYAEYTVTQRQQNKRGQESGSYTFHIMIDKSDPDDLKLEIVQDYYGDYIEDNVARKQVLLEKKDGQYIYTVRDGEETKRDKVDDQFALDYVMSFFYRNNNAFNEGGLYYGDFFLLYIYKYPASSFSVERENESCIFNEKINVIDAETGDVHLHQISEINKYGLLKSNYERYESVDKDIVLISELSAEYRFSDADLSA